MIPYEKTYGGLPCNGGDVACFELAFCSRAIITKIIVEQTEGIAAQFKVTLYNKSGVCEGNSASDSEADPFVGPLPPRLFKVTPELSSLSAGILEYFADSSTGGAGFTFFNHDKNPDNMRARIGNARSIYLKLDVSGTGVKKFAVAIAGLEYQPGG